MLFMSIMCHLKPHLQEDSDSSYSHGDSATLSEQPHLCAGLVLEPLPVGAWAFLSVTAAIFTKTLTFSQAFSAFTNDVIWLIVVSFFFAKVRQKPSITCLYHACCHHVLL